MLAVGTEIKGYRIERLLGRGGMGEVYEATQLGLDRTVALKVLPAAFVDNFRFRARFRREGQRQAALEHPNVVTVYEAGELEDGLFLAMRLVRGPNLKELLRDEEIDTDRALRLLAPVADALDTAHRFGLVHRDVKPQNILIGPEDHPYLADFGLTRGPDDTGLTGTGQFVGTVSYVSPEQVMGQVPQAAGDIYSLAAVLFECLTGRTPYPRPSEAAILYAHAHDPPPRITEARPDLPSTVDGVIAAGMAKTPAERPRTARELIAAAEAAVESHPATSRPRGVHVRFQRRAASASGQAPVDAPAVRTTPPELAARPGRRARGRLPRPALAFGALALIALAGAAFAFGHSGEKEAPGPALTTSASSDSVALEAPSSWERTPRASLPVIPGLELSDSVGVRSTDAPASGAVAGVSSARGESLLPASFESRVAGALPEPSSVRLGDVEALRYAEISVRGLGRPLTLYTAPTTTGVVTVACYAAQASQSGFLPECERVAQTLKLERGRPYPLALGAGSITALTKIVTDLSQARRGERAQLRVAGTPSAQAKAANSLDDAYASAGTRVERLRLSPALGAKQDATVRALRSAAAAYAALATAANRDDRDAYARASAKVRAAERKVERRLRSFER